MGVLIQAFYRDCPAASGREGTWWNFVNENLAEVRAAGFSALWLPPPGKTANLDATSLGYDPFDYYDLGDLDQKGAVKTRFGNQAELSALIAAAHALGMQVYADVVINQNSGGDAEPNPMKDGAPTYTRFAPKSGKFPRDWRSFHPSIYEVGDEGTFGGMPDLCHRNPDVLLELVAYARFLLETLAFDGLRFDYVKGYGAWVVRTLMELRYLRGDTAFSPFGVGECWDDDEVVVAWEKEVNAGSDNPVHAFDFPLQDRLRDLCQSDGFDLRTLADGGTVVADSPEVAVTFVENHDTDGTANAIVSDKLLAYAFILTHEGYPCVYWRDYFNYDLARAGSPNGIAALVIAHEKYAGGDATVLSVDDDVYVMQRPGAADLPGLVLVLNHGEGSWSGRPVNVGWSGKTLEPIAWWSAEDSNTPDPQTVAANGEVTLWAPPRGYVVYAPS